MSVDTTNDEEIRNQIVLAIEANNIEALKNILTSNPGIDLNFLANFKIAKTKVSPLIAAVKFKNLEIIQLLQSHGANINFLAEDGGIALFHAVANGFNELVDYLIKNNADVNHVDQNGYTALKLAALTRNEPAAIMIEHRINYLMEEEFIQAVNDNDVVALDKIMTKIKTTHPGFDINSPWYYKIDDRFPMPPIIAAAKSGNIEIIKKLIQYGANIEAMDEFRATAIFHAAADGLVEVFDFLLQNGAKIDHVDMDGKNLLTIAINNNKPAIVKSLLSKMTLKPEYLELIFKNLCNNRNWIIAKLIAEKMENFDDILLLNLIESSTKERGSIEKIEFLRFVVKKKLDIAAVNRTSVPKMEIFQKFLKDSKERMEFSRSPEVRKTLPEYSQFSPFHIRDIERGMLLFPDEIDRVKKAIDKKENDDVIKYRRFYEASGKERSKETLTDTEKGLELPYSVIVIKDEKGDKVPYALYEGKDPADKDKARVIGKGGYGRVKLAQNLNTGEWVVVKIQKYEKNEYNLETRLERVRAESEFEKQQGYHIGSAERKLEEQTKFYHIQKPLGHNLSEFLNPDNSDQFTADIGVRMNFALKFLDELAKLHENGIIHRDIKPLNIMFDKKTGELTIIDFGLARNLEGEPPVYNKSTGTIYEDSSGIGTPYYLDPKIEDDKILTEGKDPLYGYSERTDMFSAGKTLKEILYDGLDIASYPAETVKVMDRLIENLTSENRDERINARHAHFIMLELQRELMKHKKEASVEMSNTLTEPIKDRLGEPAPLLHAKDLHTPVKIKDIAASQDKEPVKPSNSSRPSLP